MDPLSFNPDPSVSIVKTANEKRPLQAEKIAFTLEEKKINNRIPKFGTEDYATENVIKRRQWLEQKTSKKLTHIAGEPVNSQAFKGNIENLIGVAQIPIGVAGPLLINGEHASGEYYIPMATTEGAIITTYHVGMRLITQSGGAHVMVEDKYSHISPMFKVEGLQDAKLFKKWIEANFTRIKAVAESTTSHGKLLDIQTNFWDRRAVLKFLYSTGDAQGMNMINVATEEACHFISNETGKKFNTRSNYSAVKKVSLHNMGATFGKSVYAEATIPAEVLKKLNVSAQDIALTWHESVSICAKSNILGVNCQATNGIAAIFLACGQDIADISSSHITHADFVVVNEDSLHVEVYIPSLVIGTVGGGTGKGTQKECLNVMDCYGTGKAYKFAEIIGAAVLAGELATACAIVNGTFVKAHAALGRNKPTIPV